MAVRLTSSGGWADLGEKVEDRALPAPDVQQSPFPTLTSSAPLDVTTSNVLRVSDAYACVRVLADGIATLPLHVYRRTDAGRVRAGDNARAVKLLARPAPGSTGVDLISQVMVHLNVYGEAFVGKYRSGDGEIAQLGLLPPENVQVELRGQRIVYTLDSLKGRTEHGPDDILHIKGMSLDGLRGLSPVTQCRVALGLSGSLQQSAKTFTEQGSKPSGVLSVTGEGNAAERIQAAWQARHGGVENHHKIAVVTGDITWTPVGFSQDDAQFLQQRELSAREVARIFRVPAWVIDAPTGDSLTYANVAEQNRALATHSLRPWATRIERAISNDADLCLGGTYVGFDFDAIMGSSTLELAAALRRREEPSPHCSRAVRCWVGRIGAAGYRTAVSRASGHVALRAGFPAEPRWGWVWDDHSRRRSRRCRFRPAGRLQTSHAAQSCWRRTTGDDRGQ